MDIRKLLKEDTFSPLSAYMHLDSLHIATLRKIAKGIFDPSQISPKVENILNDLINYGLVDEYGNDITPEGERALQYADRLGGSVQYRKSLSNKTPTTIDDSSPEYNDIDNNEFY